MGSFVGHALPGTLFLLVGLWHVWSAVSRHAAGPESFRVRAWSPAPSWLGGGRLAKLELYLVVGGAFLDLCIELFYSTHLRIFVDGGVLNPAHMNDFEHAGMLLMFCLFGFAALLSESTRALSGTQFHFRVPPSAARGAVPAGRRRFQRRVPALLLPLHHPQGTGGLLPPPPRPPHRPVCGVCHSRGAAPHLLPRRPLQRHRHHPAGRLVLPDGLRALRPHDARGVPARGRPDRVPACGQRGPGGAACQPPAFRARLPGVGGSRRVVRRRCLQVWESRGAVQAVCGGVTGWK